jgi:ABC-type molybdate transport system substrate-binding protein
LDVGGQNFADAQNLSGDDRTLPDESGLSRTVNNGVLADQLEQRLHDKDEEIAFLRGELLHRRTTDSALHDVIAAFRANAETQRIAASNNSSDGQGTSTRSQ